VPLHLGPGAIGGLEEMPRPVSQGAAGGEGDAFGRVLKDAIAKVDGLEKESEAAQAAFAKGGDVELHDVIIRIEEAEVAFKTLMEVRNKLVDAYREIMRMGA
jgi:flagellar hook-basal body complex protein FliE